MATRRGSWSIDRWDDLLVGAAVLAFGWLLAADLVDQYILRPIWAVAQWIGHPLGQDVRTALAFVTASELCIAWLVLLLRERRNEERARREREARTLPLAKAYWAGQRGLSSIPADTVGLCPSELELLICSLVVPPATDAPPPVAPAPPPESPDTRIPAFPGRILFLEQAQADRAVLRVLPRETPKPPPFVLSQAVWEATLDRADLL